MSERQLNEPHPLLGERSVSIPSGQACQETILHIVTVVDELTADGIQCVTNRSKIINNPLGEQIALRSFGLPEGLMISKQAKADLKKDSRVAGISTFEDMDTEGIGLVRLENRYDIVENMGEKALKIIQHFDPEVGPGWAADLSEDKARLLLDYLQGFKPVSPQAD